VPDPYPRSIRRLTQRFVGHVAVDGIDLSVAVGECFGLLGPNGPGKTTTIRVLVTLLPVQDGEVRVFGLDVRRRPTGSRSSGSALPGSWPS
jgi:ABC-2 type transport system ATP-binding protein